MLFLFVNCCCSVNLMSSEIWSVWLFHHLYCSPHFRDTESWFCNFMFFAELLDSEPPQSLLRLLPFLLVQSLLIFTCNVQEWWLCPVPFTEVLWYSSLNPWTPSVQTQSLSDRHLCWGNGSESWPCWVIGTKSLVPQLLPSVLPQGDDTKGDSLLFTRSNFPQVQGFGPVTEGIPSPSQGVGNLV